MLSVSFFEDLNSWLSCYSYPKGISSVHCSFQLVFRTGPSERVAANTNRSSVHYRIVSSLVSLLSFTSGDEFFYRNLLYFTWVFFDIVVKSMAQTILREQKTKVRDVVHKNSNS